MSGNPLNAPERKELPRQNYVRLIRNEIVDMPLALKEKSGISAAEQVDFWQLTYEALDVKWSDDAVINGDNFFAFQFGNKLETKKGDALDKTNPPYICSAAFAGLGLNVWVSDPDYDGSEIGECFILEQTKFFAGTQFEKMAPIPIERLGKDFTFDGEVRVIQTKAEREAGGTASAVAATVTQTVEITDNDEAAMAIASALVGLRADDKAGILTALSSIGPGKTLNGGSFMGRMASDLSGAIEALQTAGIIATVDGTIDAYASTD